MGQVLDGDSPGSDSFEEALNGWGIIELKVEGREGVAVVLAVVVSAVVHHRLVPLDDNQGDAVARDVLTIVSGKMGAPGWPSEVSAFSSSL